ncbi:MAG: ribulose-phosphate 3-epimerase [Gammaproteobacteria bacterium]|nr:ribulose-phosphate 3-epimerase [Gammaproteobacteria bacterium]
MKISASILNADYARLGEDTLAAIQGGADEVHFDVMDNHFVPNLSVGPAVCDSLKQYLQQQDDSTPIDVHLMTQPVDELIDGFTKAGADRISFHVPASNDVERSLLRIKGHDCKAGLVLNPDEAIDVIEPWFGHIDRVLVMSVNPGFGGQGFIRDCTGKITKLRQLIDSKKLAIEIAVDGGINQETIKLVAEAGADVCIVGSAIFGSDDYKKTIHQLKQ